MVSDERKAEEGLIPRIGCKNADYPCSYIKSVVSEAEKEKAP